MNVHANVPFLRSLLSSGIVDFTTRGCPTGPGCTNRCDAGDLRRSAQRPFPRGAYSLSVLGAVALAGVAVNLSLVMVHYIHGRSASGLPLKGVMVHKLSRGPFAER